LLQGIWIEIHGRHEPQSGGVDLKSGQKIGRDDGRGDAMEVNQEINRGDHTEDDPSMGILIFRLFNTDHDDVSLRFQMDFEGAIYIKAPV
jgi:hypothetical protein